LLLNGRDGSLREDGSGPFSVEVVAGGTVQSRDIGGVFLAEGGAEDGGQESG
jgi:hypothetical protein